MHPSSALDALPRTSKNTPSILAVNNRPIWSGSHIPAIGVFGIGNSKCLLVIQPDVYLLLLLRIELDDGLIIRYVLLVVRISYME